jgi:imidazolonepropionase-like amidohydrolase
MVSLRIFRAGPVLDGSKPSSRDRLVIDTADDGRRVVSFVKARGLDFIKVHNGAPPAAYFAMLAEARKQGLAVVGHLHREGVRFLVGTDLAAPLTYPGSSVHEELAWLVKAGLTPMEALVAGTRNGAEAVGRLGDLGTIEKGKLADLVLLDASPLAEIASTQKIAAVIANGRLLRREALDRLLAQVAKDAAGR